MTSYRVRLQEMVDGLRATPGVVLRHAALGPPASQASLATARTYGLYHLPAGVEDLYSEVDGFSVSWEYPDGPGPDSPEWGAVDLVPIARVFASWMGTTWWDDFEGGDRFRNVKPFDLFVSEACGAFLQEPDQPPGDEVAFHYFGEGTRAMGMSFPIYIDRMLMARGYQYWQRGFVDHATLPALGDRLSQLFGDFDLDAFTAPAP